MMQELRDWYGKPLNVSSWYRTKSFNKSCNGSKNSAHLDGVKVQDVDNEALAYVDVDEMYVNQLMAE